MSSANQSKSEYFTADAMSAGGAAAMAVVAPNPTFPPPPRDWARRKSVQAWKALLSSVALFALAFPLISLGIDIGAIAALSISCLLFGLAVWWANDARGLRHTTDALIVPCVLMSDVQEPVGKLLDILGALHLVLMPVAWIAKALLSRRNTDAESADVRFVLDGKPYFEVVPINSGRKSLTKGSIHWLCVPSHRKEAFLVSQISGVPDNLRRAQVPARVAAVLKAQLEILDRAEADTRFLAHTKRELDRKESKEARSDDRERLRQDYS